MLIPIVCVSVCVRSGGYLASAASEQERTEYSESHTHTASQPQRENIVFSLFRKIECDERKAQCQ